MNYDSTYFWRVTAKNSIGTTDNSQWDFISVKNLNPTPSSDPRPTNGATNTPITGTNLTWSPSADPEGGPVYYETWFGVPNNMALVDASGVDTTTTLGILAGGVTYNWMIKAVDDAGNKTAGVGSPWEFTTIYPPSAPIAIAPLNGSDWNHIVNTTLKWESIAQYGAVTFDVYFGSSPNDLQVVSSNQRDAFFELRRVPKKSYHSTTDPYFNFFFPLHPHTMYYWKIVAKGSGGTTESPTWSFKTISWANA